MLKITGRSLETVLEDRVAVNVLSGVPQAEWTLQDTPEWVARNMFSSICVNGQANANDVLPFIVMNQTLFPVDTIPESTFEIIWYQKPDTLYKALKDLCDIYDMGFRLYRNGDASQLFFNIYKGSDRTTRQQVLTPVIFSPELGNVASTNELTTIAKTKNCAYVMATRDDVTYGRWVYPEDVDPLIAGFDRRVLYVSAELAETDVTTADINARLDRQGLDELAKNRAFTAFDGEVSQYTQYKYGVDYYLGDLVMMQNSDGFMNNMRVTEQIFVSDREGDRAYPTLAINLSIFPGSWESWGYQAWEDIGPTEYWSNQR
jgi:hypothetical protein